MLAKKGRCLIAEDEGMTMRFIRRTLEQAGYQIIGVASDGKRAIEASLELEPDFLVINLNMPRMSGIEAARHISAVRSLPIVMVSGYQDDATIESAFSAGVSTFLTKPFLPEELLEAVESTLERF